MSFTQNHFEHWTLKICSAFHSFSETLKVVEEGRSNLSKFGLVLDEEVGDDELEDLWQKDILLNVFAAKKAAKAFKKKSKAKKNSGEKGENVKSSLQSIEEKLKGAYLHDFNK